MNQALFKTCLAAAQTIVQSYRNTVPEGTEYYNGSTGQTDSAAANKRRGTSLSVRSSVLPNFLSDLVTNSAQNASLPQNWVQGSDNLISGLLTRDNADLPGNEHIDSALSGLESNDFFVGTPSLENQARIDPTTSTYETDTLAKYQDRVNQGLTQIASGPDVVRGGTARNSLAQGEAVNRMALERGDEVRRQRDADSNLSTRASQMLMSLEQGRRAALMQGGQSMVSQYLQGMGQSMGASGQVNDRAKMITDLWQMAAKMLGSSVASTSEDAAGFGSQQSSSWNFGINI